MVVEQAVIHLMLLEQQEVLHQDKVLLAEFQQAVSAFLILLVVVAVLAQLVPILPVAVVLVLTAVSVYLLIHLGVVLPVVDKT